VGMSHNVQEPDARQGREQGTVPVEKNVSASGCEIDQRRDVLWPKKKNRSFEGSGSSRVMMYVDEGEKITPAENTYCRNRKPPQGGGVGRGGGMGGGPRWGQATSPGPIIECISQGASPVGKRVDPLEFR